MDDREMLEEILRARAERRPTLEDVVRVVDSAFKGLRESGELDVVPVLQGPDVWTWSDQTVSSQGGGVERVYCLTRSHAPGAEGYPLMTVRQVVAPNFDSSLSLSTLVFGPDDDAIAHSMAVLITNHAAAFAGLRDSFMTIARGGGAGAVLEDLRQSKLEFDAKVGKTIAKKGELN